MKQFKFLAMALAALTMFSCSKENHGPEVSEGERTMEISIAKTKTSSGTKAPGVPQSDYTTPIVDDKVEIFCFESDDDTKVILKKVAVTLQNNKAKISVPDNTGYVYVVANASPVVTVGTTTLSGLKAVTFDVKDYQEIGIVPMANIGTQVLDKTTDPLLWELGVKIAPLMARLEIASVTGTNTGTDAENDVQSFNLVGVHINRYYTSFPLGGANSGTIVPEVTDGDQLRTISSDLAWTYDFFNPALTGQLTYTAVNAPNPGANTVWAYMLAPVASAETMPKIVLEISNVRVNNQNHDLRFVTVKKFIDGNGDVVTSLDRNSIYKVTDIRFTASKTTTDPNQEDVFVNVTVSVEKWNEHTITPEL